jgi:hypothetical protein
MTGCKIIQVHHARIITASLLSLAMLLVVGATPAFAGGVGAQIFLEDFEGMGFVPIGGWGPQGLIDEGWIFENNSEPLGSQAWFSGCCWEGVISPLSGTGYLAASQDSAGGASAQYSAWAIVPTVPGQQAGDLLTFFTISSDTSPFESVHLEVRYAPNGGDETGESASDVGDFTDLLLFISPMPNYNEGLYDGWTKWELALPGSGRIAFRQVGSESMYFGLEDVSVSHPGKDPGPMPEGFEDLDGICGEGPCRLINEENWIFRDQGSLAVGPAWQPPFAGDEFTAHSGVSFIKSLKGGDSGSIATWAILPPIGNVAGDELSFVVRGALQEGGVFQIRYSPSGATSSGSGATGTGDFTQVLLEMTDLPYDAWQQVSVDIPGNGRMALRVFDPNQPFFDFATIVAVDTMDLNPAPTGPPLPGPGETVTWTAAISPIEIDTDLFIPQGGTVIVEPGVQIIIAAEATLSVGGTLEGDGTETQPIVIESVANFPPGIIVSGTLDLAFAEINTQVRPDLNGSLLFNDCTFSGPNGIIFNQMGIGITLDDVPPFVLIENCTFDDADVRPTDATIRIADSTFINADAAPLRGYVFVDNLDITGGGLSISRDQQNVYINDITVQDSPGPAIRVDGSNIGNDYLFGPDNILTGNLYPAAVAAGVLPGSTLPQSGNSINAVLIQPVGFEIFGPVTWADPGIPYHVDQSPFLVGGFDVLPGVTMKFQPDHGFAETSGFEARGLPDNLVSFEPLTSQWYAIFTPQRLEYSVIDGSEFGIVNDALGLPGYFDSVDFIENDRAIVGHAYIRKSRFLDNNVGADISGFMDLDGQTNPNSFEGNNLAVLEASDATHNWWGDPTGPTIPQNPGGQGDPVTSGVPVLPFLTAPPDIKNHPPIVDMQDIYFVAEPGSTVILNWHTTDEDLVSHRILLSTQSDVLNQYDIIAEDLPASQRSFALTVPTENLVFGVWYVRIEGIDSLGQVGWDRKFASARQVSIDPTIVPPPVPPADSFVLGYPIPLDEDVTHFFTGWVLLDGQYAFESFGAAGVLPTRVDASSDTVRVGLNDGASWSFSEYFTVRPDERLGDDAPAVTLSAPTGGSFGGGSTVNIAWSASDDEGVRFVTLQGSYDGGLTWHDIARRLPGELSSYNWQLPPLEQTIDNVLVRVVVEDLRFQNSSDTSGAITLLPGVGGPLIGDLNNDGAVGPADLAELLAQWGACGDCGDCPADLDGSCNVGPGDLAEMLANWG